MKIRTIRNVILVSFISLLFGCATQQKFESTEIKQVVEVGNKDKETIFNSARQWFSEYFVSGKSVVDYEDKKEGVIIGNGIATIGTGPLGLIEYKIKYQVRVDTKDSKFRASTKVIEHMNSDTKSTYSVYSVSTERANNAEAHVKKIISELESYVSNNTSAQGNW